MKSLLTSRDAQHLERPGLLLPGATPGMLRLHKRRLTRTADKEFRSIPLEVAPDSPFANDAFADLPSVLVSRETLVYVGYTDKNADYIWKCWTNWPDDGSLGFREGDPDNGGPEITFLDHLMGYIPGTKERKDADGDNDEDWNRYLDECGINADVRSRIMHPRFAYLRRTESCFYWIRDTIEMRYGGLEMVRLASLERGKHLRRAESLPRASVSSATSGRNSSRRSASRLPQEPPDLNDLDIWGATRVAPQINVPNQLTLFKCLDQYRTRRVLNRDGTPRNLAPLVSFPLTHCSRTHPKYYFTSDIKVAEYYARFAKHRIGVHSVGIVMVHIPHSAINRIPKPDVQRIAWPSAEWKSFIWHNCKGREPPESLKQYENALLLIQPASSKPLAAWRRTESPRQVDDSYVLRIGDRREGQADPRRNSYYWIFHGGSNGYNWLSTNIYRIKVMPYPQTELDAYFARNAGAADGRSSRILEGIP